jgi:SAM-dependent methyltransferase
MAPLKDVLAELNQKGQRRIFPYITRRLGGEDVVFFNWAYEEDPPMAIPLDTADEPNRFPIQLYHATASQVDLRGKKVLEVGCGHGGGADYVTRSLRPDSYTALDLNARGIAFCQRRNQLPELEFIAGDAQNLPFPDESFDAVINVESSHCYPRLDRFFAEVTRVLRGGGDFLYTDMRPAKHVAEWEAAIADTPLQVVAERDIGVEVVRGMENNSSQMRPLIDRMPAPLRRLAPLWAPVRGSNIQKELRRGQLVYRIYHLTKP